MGLPSFEEFCLKVSLYTEYYIGSYDIENIIFFHIDNYTFESYCVDCKKERTFSSLLPSFSENKQKYIEDTVNIVLLKSNKININKDLKLESTEF